MCRSIRSLHNYDPPTSDEEIRGAALQYVRKVSGTTRPSAANSEAFERAGEAVTTPTTEQHESLVTSAQPRNRAVEIARAKERSIARFG
jgi:hypothetical protein